MQTKYTPKTGLRNKIVTWGLAGLTVLISGFNSGCNFQSAYEKKFNSLSPEEQAKWRQEDYDLITRMRMNEEKQKEQELALITRMNENEAIQKQQTRQDYPVKSQEDTELRDLTEIYKGVLIRSGSDLTTYEYMKRNP